MSRRGYGQFCGLARALEVVGDRWALLIVRDLWGGPARYTDLAKGLPGIPSNVLSARLRELEDIGVLHRVAVPRPGTGVVYELTEDGRALREVLLGLGRWGSRYLTRPGDGEVVTPACVSSALQALFRPEAATGVRATFELAFSQPAERILGPGHAWLDEVVVHARVEARRISCTAGPAVEPDLRIATKAERMLDVLAGTAAPRDVRLSGDTALLPVFSRLFRPPDAPG
jgi:DNA-binding HxlR family transcriptional regulator